MFSLVNMIFCFLGTSIGIVFGAIPGLTATMAIALFLPFTFGMESVPAFALLLGLYVGGVYGGSITAILINTPGTPGAAATAVEGYPLARQGKALDALSLATISSFIGGMLSCGVLILLAPRLARVALQFGPPEYFAISLFGLSMVSSIASKNIMKGIVSAAFGLLAATIGIDPIVGSMRLTFGNVNLVAGIGLICSLIGLFAISEVLSKLETINRNKGIEDMEKITGKFVSLKILKANVFNFLRSSAIGIGIGLIPAVGVSMANWISYNEAKRMTKTPELYGEGCFEGVAASETSNNAVTGGALVPMLTLGIPGDAMTAVLLGALMIQGLAPGARLFNDTPEVVRGIYGMLALANIFMLILGLGLINVFVKIIKVPINILMPLVLIMCYIGSYAIHNNFFDVYVALLFGIIAYLSLKAKFPLPPMLLGIILGPLIESNFRRSITMSRGSLVIFFERPLSAVFIIIALSAMIYPLLRENINFKTK